jgi:flagellar biosynthesis protein FlhG
MTDAIADQAAGLRRMLAPPPLRSAAVVGVSAAAASGEVTANLAVALAAQGRDVVVIDADAEGRGPARLLNAGRGRDLLDGVRSGCAPEEVGVQVRPTLRVVQAQRFFGSLDQLRPMDCANLAEVLAAVCRDADALFVAAGAGNLPALAIADALLIVTLDDADSLTRAYRLLKRNAAEAGRQHASVLFNRVQSRSRSDRIFANLAATSAQFLSLPLECMGTIPDDAHMERAAELRQPVVELFPASVSAAALRSCADAFMLAPFPEATTVHSFAARVISTVRSAVRGSH